MDSHYKIRSFNERAGYLLQKAGPKKLEEGLSIFSYCLPASQDKLRAKCRQAMEDGSASWTRKLGGRGSLVYQYTIEPFAAGPFTGLLLKMTDISRYAGVEDELNKSNERYKLATRASYDMIWERDFSRDRYYFSEALLTVYGYDHRQEWSWQDVMNKLIHYEDREMVINFVRDCYQNKIELFRCPVHRYMRKDGTVLWVDVRCIAIYNSAGQNTRTIGVTRDISREYYLQQDLRHQSIQLKASNTELERFVYIASHDLQEPLRMVNNFLTLLQKKYDDRLDDNARLYISFAADGAQRMQARVQGLLDLAKVGAGDKKEDIDLEELMQDALRDLSISIAEKQAVIVTGSTLPVIFADKSQIYLVIVNLLGNALKYTKETSPRIEVSCEEQAEQWQISVKDNGIGIEERYYEKIFEMFQRLHQRDQYSGTGIGLAIVKKIVEGAGGRIWVNSRPGMGSCFYFTVPKAQKKSDILPLK